MCMDSQLDPRPGELARSPWVRMGRDWRSGVPGSQDSRIPGFQDSWRPEKLSSSSEDILASALKHRAGESGDAAVRRHVAGR